MFGRKKLKLNKFIFFGALFLSFLAPYSFSIHDNLMSAEPAEASVIDANLQSIGFEINKTRASYGLGELSFDTTLLNFAEARIIDMIYQKYIGHINPQGSSLEYFANQAGYNYLFIGENLSINYHDASEMVQAWLNSPAHRDNLLKPEYDEMGLACGLVEKDGEKKYVVVFMLGKEKNLALRQLLAR